MGHPRSAWTPNVTRRANTIAIARLVFIAIYVVAFIPAGFGHWSRTVFVALYVVL